MPGTTYPKILKAGTQAAYNGLETKDADVLYFCTDSGKIYKGEVDFSSSIVVAATRPSTPVVGKMYINTGSGALEAYVNDAWRVLSYPIATTITVSSDDTHVATAKAVYDAIQAAVAEITGGGTVVKGVAAGASPATITVTKGDNSTSNVTIPGVVTKPTWDATQRKLTIPVTGDTAVEVNIGKDIFLDSTAPNGYNEEDHTIDLYLNDGTGGAGSGTKISIPATELVDVYTGTTSNGTSVTVGADNTIKVNLVVDPVAGNGLTLSAAGLKVDLSAYAKTVDVEADLGELNTAIEEVEAIATANQSAITILNGNSSTAGSVDYKILAAKNELNGTITTLSGRVGTLETDNTTNKTNIATNTQNIANLAAATTVWGTF